MKRLKKLKRIISMTLAVVMVLAMSMTIGTTEVEATEVSVTTVSNLSDHSFAAYQIFTGDYDSTSNTLSNVAWGDGVTSNTLLSTLVADTTVVVAKDANSSGDPSADITVASLFSTDMTASQVAAVLETYSTNDTLLEAFVDAAYTAKTSTSTAITAGSSSVTLASGYYLIVDTTENVSSSTTVKAYNNALLQVVGTSITINQKTDSPSVEKKVYEESYSESSTGYVTGYNDVADYDIGDTVAYQLIGTVPESDYIKYYSTYSYVFNDTLSKGLTYDTDSIKVYLATDKSSDASWVEIPTTYNNGSSVTNYTVATGSATATEGTYYEGSTLTVSFDDILSLVDSSGNTIDVSQYSYIIVEYTATLNSNAVIGLDGNPNEVYLTYSSNPNVTTDTANTTTDTVIVFTYELDVTKVDSTTTTTTLEGATFRLYKMSGSDKYYYIGSSSGTSDPWNTTANSTDGAATFTTIAGGTFSIAGLDDGIYYLEETVAPTGYNLLSNPIEFTISATTANGQSWTGTASEALTVVSLSISSGTDAASNTTGGDSVGVVSMQITNTKGSGLPTTGGMGTTVFYIIGGILILGAAIALVIRNRRKAR